MLSKLCSACERTLPASQFSRDVSRSDGLMIRCRACDRARNRAYYARTGRRSKVRGAYVPKPRFCPCGELATSTKHRYCDACRARAEAKRNSKPRPATNGRGYGAEHQRRRRQVARDVDAGVAVCARCLRPIVPGSLWDLDHTDDRSGYNGPAHRSCNRSAGAVKGNRMRAFA